VDEEADLDRHDRVGMAPIMMSATQKDAGLRVGRVSPSRPCQALMHVQRSTTRAWVVGTELAKGVKGTVSIQATPPVALFDDADALGSSGHLRQGLLRERLEGLPGLAERGERAAHLTRHTGL
jgi:hypothetical protein